MNVASQSSAKISRFGEETEIAHFIASILVAMVDMDLSLLEKCCQARRSVWFTK